MKRRRLIGHPDFSEPDVSAILPTLTAAGATITTLSYWKYCVSGNRSRPRTRGLGLAYERTGKLAERAALEQSVSGDRPTAALLGFGAGRARSWVIGARWATWAPRVWG